MARLAALQRGQQGAKAPKPLLAPAALEATFARQRQQEHQRAQLTSFYQEQKTYDAQARNAERVEARVHQRQAVAAAQEAAQAAAAQEAERLAQAARARVAEEQQLAAELERRIRHSDRHSKEVQLLLQRSDEIRRLKEQLLVAEVGRQTAPRSPAALYRHIGCCIPSGSHYVKQTKAAKRLCFCPALCTVCR